MLPPQLTAQTWLYWTSIKPYMTDLTHTLCSKKDESLFEQGDKMGKLLAILVAVQRAQTNIPCIKMMTGQSSLDPKVIYESFVQYYSLLYALYHLIQLLSNGTTSLLSYKFTGGGGQGISGC